MGPTVECLKKVSFLEGLSSGECLELAAACEVKRYGDGDLVFSLGEPIPGIFVVLNGSLKVFRTDGRGKLQILDILHPGDFVGEVQAFDGGPIASGAEARGETECLLIPGQQLRRIALGNPVVAEHIIRHFASKVRMLISLVETLSLHSVPERVAQLILDYQQRNPSRTLVEFSQTQEDLAQCIGASREAFSRALRLLSDLGLVQSTFPVVRIVDIPKLQRYARG
nr:Crp/Fnr family transcriptional regulator [uncultured Holophaga sp.]